MRGRYRIVVSSRGSPDPEDAPRRPYARIKAGIAGVGVLIVVFGGLLAALVFGSMLVVALWVALWGIVVLAVGTAVVRNTWRRVRDDRRF